MNLKEYQLAAVRTCPDLGSLENNLIHMDMGITSEIGELVDIMKRNFAYGKAVDIVHLGEEIGDVMWYIANKYTLRGIEILVNPFPTKYLGGKLSSIQIFRELKDYLEKGEDEIMLILKLGAIAFSYDLNFETLLGINIAKLKARYPDKFDAHKALNRDLDAERKILENGSIQEQTNQ